ncbi:MAG: VOC family protein [Melioribacteraceae bacterium]|nr:VOC family protein [Melioribacteraceae bacterium]MCF8353688.1 VOC family protein [Melioribacteraceae bacterium]MCF8394470.1 VOC family protein [Melioribacteraceae bacterium]MCF8418604.1 VOC family protein [Melioribacteraceae bacterium]
MQKITPCLWFDTQAEEAALFYTSLFDNSKIGKTAHHDESSAQASGQSVGSALTIEFEINGYKFLGLNGGPHFKLNPSVSFFLNFDPSKDNKAKEKLDSVWEKLSKDGEVLMPLDKYPFSEHYGWVQDKYGVSWQLILTNPDGDDKPFIVPSFLFVGNVCGKAEEAGDFYISVFKDSKRGQIARYPAGMEPDTEGTIMFTDFLIEKQWFAAMDSAREHNFNFSEGISFIVNCGTQEEVNYYWNNLSSVPEAEQCGWLKDKYGVSWQIIPDALPKLLTDPDKEKAGRAMQAMLQMKKIEIADLEKAYNGE